MDEKANTTAKKPYTKPVVRPIELVTGEVLGSGCKMAGKGGPESAEGPCDFPSPCDGDGS